MNPTGTLAMLGGPGSLALVGLEEADEEDEEAEEEERAVLARAKEPPKGRIRETQFNFGLDDTLCAVAAEHSV